MFLAVNDITTMILSTNKMRVGVVSRGDMAVSEDTVLRDGSLGHADAAAATTVLYVCMNGWCLVHQS